MIQMIKPRTTLDGSFSVYGFLKTFVPVYPLSFLLFTFWRHGVSENLSSQFVLLLAQGLCRNWVPSPPPFPRWRRVSEASKSKLRQSARPVEPRQMSPGMVILIRCRPCCPPKYLTDKFICGSECVTLFCGIVQQPTSRSPPNIGSLQSNLTSFLTFATSAIRFRFRKNPLSGGKW